MTDTRTPLGWVRNDREVTWWGADYPVHWEPGEGFAIYGEPAQAQADAVAAELTPDPSVAALHDYCLRQAESNDDAAVRYDEDAADWAQNPDPFKAKRADNSRAVAAQCRKTAVEFRKWARALSDPLNVERLCAALRECQDKLWVGRCNSGDEAFRAAAERACDMASEALKATPHTPAFKDEAALKASVKDLITHRRAGDYDLMADDVANALWPLLRNAVDPTQAAALASGKKMNAWIGDILAQATAGPKEGLRSADHLFDLIAGSLFDHPHKSAPLGGIRLLADDLWTMIGLQAASDQFAAFRAGWRTNAALPADDPAYFERSIETDWMDYLKRGAADYNAALDASAQELETEAALALTEDVPAVEVAAEALYRIGRRYGWWKAMGMEDRAGYRTPEDPIAQREFEAVVEEILEAGRVVRSDAYKAASEALEKCWGALNFVLAFYDPGQRHLDTNAWKQAEAGARQAHAHARVVLDELKVKPEDEENPWRSQAEWSDLLRRRDDYIVNEGLWADFVESLMKHDQAAAKS
ncbi:hypothetical protein DOMOVOI_00980 [Brevundimonas phage vB_BpoS-Domovoi]|uniref:Uncharacterized protein n=1 Tax=Brevundimonas phage vB_BpoS-Domovoi TaxID=2948598 RepID=A0A9E7SJL7_9CAUD|nr:hypothetical protein DOMOVOI_00980 [Brevundimonas phage vB_BpoS-Domovoi]